MINFLRLKAYYTFCRPGLTRDWILKASTNGGANKELSRARTDMKENVKNADFCLKRYKQKVVVFYRFWFLKYDNVKIFVADG